MKHVVVFLGGVAGDVDPALESRTPLEAAHTPALDETAVAGRPAAIERDPWERPTTIESLFALANGRDPVLQPLGPAVLQAAGLDALPAAGTVMLVVDLVTIEGGRLVHLDAGGLTDDEGRSIVTALEPLVADIHPEAELRHAHGHRALLSLPAIAGPDALGFLPPQSRLGMPVADAVPVGERTEEIRGFIEAARALLAGHEVTAVRRDAGLPLPTHPWPWGVGIVPEPWSPADRYEGVRLGVVGTGLVDRGFARLAGAPHQAPADGDPRSTHVAIQQLLDETDLVLARWEPEVPRDDAAARVRAIEAADARLVAPLRTMLERRWPGAWRLAVIAGPAVGHDGRLLDHDLIAAFDGHGFHGPLEVPFVEASTAETELRFRSGDDLLEFVLFGAGVRRPRRPRRVDPESGTAVWSNTRAAEPRDD